MTCGISCLIISNGSPMLDPLCFFLKYSILGFIGDNTRSSPSSLPSSSSSLEDLSITSGVVYESKEKTPSYSNIDNFQIN